jgi:hypothetical protein
MLRILAQYDLEMAWSCDQEVIEAFPSQGADEAFRDRVCPGCPDRRTDDPHVSAGEDCVEGRAELCVPVTDQEPELAGTVAEVHQQVAGLLSDPGPGRVGGGPGDVHVAAAVLDHHKNIEAAQEDGIDVGEVDRKDRVGLHGQELSPGWPGAAGSRIETGPL